jgi:NAD(P)H dehydrogenase (quinone)
VSSAVRPTVLIIGATGRVGAAVLAALDALPDDDRPHIRALARRPEAVALTAHPISIVKGDLLDETALHTALNGIDAVFLMTGDSRDQVDLECGVIAAARSSGQPHIVKLSAITAGLPSRPSFGAFHGAIEDRLTVSGLPFTILRPTMFFQSLELFADAVKSANRLIVPAGNGAVAMIDVADVAAVVAKALTETGHTGRTYTLTGPTALTFSEVAHQLSIATTRTIGYTSPPLPIARLMMRFAGGMDWWLSGQVTDLFAAIRKDAEAHVTDDIRQILGRSPTNLESYVRNFVDFWSERK